MGNNVRWGILGTAGIAKKQLIPAIKRASNAEVVAVSSRNDMEKANCYADECHIPKRYARYEDLLNDPDIDAVYIPLPNHLHLTWAKKAAEHGKHVLCEKPAALTAAEAKEMVDACAAHGVVFMEAFMYQFHPQHGEVKRLIDSGKIGEVRLIRSNFSFQLPLEANNIRLNREMGGGSLYDVGCYCIHLTRYLTGKEPVHAYGTGYLHPELGVDTSFTGVLQMEGGVTSVFTSSFEQPADDSYEVVGTEGTIIVPYAFRPDKHQDGTGVIIVRTSDGREETLSVQGDQYRLQVEHVSDAILNGTPLLYPGEETVNNMSVVEACLHSLQEKHARVK